MDLRDLVVLTPPALPDPSLAIAAARAGARGTLDLEWVTDAHAARAAVARLPRFANGSFGIQVSADRSPIPLDELIAGRPGWVILTDWTQATIQIVRGAGIEVLAEARDLSAAQAAVAAGADGIVLKGHEAGGRVGPDTSFVLLQKWAQWAATQSKVPPVWVRGGVGANTAAACLAAGARGVVLDAQLFLARESPFADDLRKKLSATDGGETTVVGERLGEAIRIYSRADSPAAKALAEEEDRLLGLSIPADERLVMWRTAVLSRVAPDPATGVWPVGQDLGCAAGLAAKGRTVAGILQAVADRAAKNVVTAARLKPLAEDGPLAKSHGTRYPILQGPMTRVSDTAAFAAAVADGGALPFLALALSRKPEVEKLLAETTRQLGSKPWGVGILGFVPPELRQEQLEVVRAYRPKFAIIAGGRPDQAKELEKDGTATYLHVPSPGLLRMFLKDGARRFIFEGRECGGHVGPRTSFALWEAMVEVLAEHVATTPGDDIHAVFAGGIHDNLSARMVAALTAGLADRGVKIGVLIGTAYLFTKEAVAAGAITERFQKEAVSCGDTVLLETGPGHAIRCIPTPYAQTFATEKRRLRGEGKSPLETGMALERMNLGRLRVASKGVDRGAGGTLAEVAADDQYARGMYMIGQVAGLRSKVTTIADLHADVCATPVPASSLPPPPAPLPAPPPCDVAIIGMACFYPKSGGAQEYWENVLAKTNGVEEIPPTHWDWRPYYDPDPRAKDKIVSKWGGFMGDVPVDPLVFGITPKSIPSIEPLQLLLLEGVRQAMADAGYADRPFDRDRAAAILGIGGGGMPLSVAYGFRACMPLLDSIPNVPIKSTDIVALGEGILPEWTEDSFPGILLNVAAGRVANRFNLGGPNMAIDAACGSSLAALYAGVRELTTGTSDLAVVMGADTVQTPYAYVAFSKTHALSPKGRCRPFDADADGIALAEGIGVAILKRLADAERDGDRVYAVVKGVGASSDGRDKGLTAPRAEGQLRALDRAYAQARVSPARVGLVEAHGTGTVVGDQTEARALGQTFRAAGGAAQSCALGSVKSMIGHSKCAAGMAGLIKTAFALHHKVLPPTLAEKPNPRANLDGGPLYLNTEARPWVHGPDFPRTAGVSAFGFGGTNFHTVLEEYTGDYLGRRDHGFKAWPAELVVFRRPDRRSLVASVTHVRDALVAGASPTLADVAASTWQSSAGPASSWDRGHPARVAGPAEPVGRSPGTASEAGRMPAVPGETFGTDQPTLAIVATSLTDLKDKLDAALAALAEGEPAYNDPRGIYFAETPVPQPVAFLFPGQGSQYPDMAAQLAMAFPEVREVLDEADRALADDLDRPLGKYIYPPSPFDPGHEKANREALQRTEIAQPAVGAVSLGIARLLGTLGIEPDFLAGHSYGEYVALAAAGAMTSEDLFRVSHRRGLVIQAAAKAGGMLAVDGPADEVEPLLNGTRDAWPANHNSPTQTVVAGTDAGLKTAADKFQKAGITSRRIPVACGFHSPLIAGAKGPLAKVLGEVRFTHPAKPVYSNTTAAPHGDPAGIGAQLTEHLVSPVRFRAELEAMYAAGARVFVEVGPQGVLTGLTQQTLAGKPHLAVATDAKGRPGLVQLAHLLGQLVARGVPARLDRLYHGRAPKPFDLARMSAETGKVRHTPTTWLVNGVRSRPVNGPEPRLLGQPLSPGAVSRPAISTPPVPPTTSSPRIPMPPEVTPPVLVPPSVRGDLPDGTAQVMLRYQEVMAKFLDTQKSVMLGFLGAGGVASTNSHAKALAVPPAPRPVAAPAAVPPPAPVAPAPVVTVVPTARPAAGPMDRDTLLARLLDLVSDRTGYPKEALSIDLDLEADLGVDSIKRVEILAALADTLGPGVDGKQPNLEMEKLSAIKTLRGIADYVTTALAESVAPPAVADKPAVHLADTPHPGAREGDVQRLVVNLIDAPLPARPRFAPPAGTLLLTDDGRGIATALADRLGEFDVKTAIVPVDPNTLAESLAKVRADHGPLAGLIHLNPLAIPAAGESPDDRMAREVKGLYLLARGMEADIRAAGKSGRAVLLAATAIGGRMGYGDLPDDFFAGHGGVAGFTKCLSYEWPEALVRVVDLDGSASADALAEQLLTELGDPDGPVEVGRSDRGRVTWQCDPGRLDTEGEEAVELGPDDTVLITGGARGITAKVVLELATRYQPRLVLVGSSPEPTAEAPDTAGLTAVAEIKTALMKRLAGTPAAVEAAYKRLMKDREIRANLAAIRAAGGPVEYRAVDVADGAAFGALIDELNAAGGIAAVVHGAGVIEDKLLKDKTPESFDRVFGTKVKSALTLAAKLDPARLKAFAVFASITSRYGNRGQSDYAAANEVLSKLAADLDRRWPGRVVSVAWGPWAEVGMVAELEKHLVARGLKLIAPAQGAEFAVDELVFGRKGETEVVIAGGTEQASRVRPVAA